MAGVEDGGDFDPLTVPAVMPVSVRRIAEGGFPTQFLLDYEQALQKWMQSNTANTNKRLTVVSAELGEAYAAVTTLAEAYANSEEAFAAYTVTVETRFGDVEASVVTETSARSTADSALASQITTLNSSLGTTNANLTSEISTRASADSALSSSITTLNSNLGTTNSNLSSEITTRANADTALSGSISTLSTTVGGHTSSISTLTSSVNGLSVKYAVSGYVGGSYGGFVFTGVQRADGVGANYLLEITSNVVINGNLLVTGTVTTGAAASNAFTQVVGSTSGSTSATVGLTVRTGAGVAIAANFAGASGYYLPISTFVGSFILYRNGTAIVTVANNFEASGSGSSAGIAFQATPILTVDYPGAGYHTYVAYTSNGAGLGGVSLVVTEYAR